MSGDFRMKQAYSSLSLALAFSALFHGALLLGLPEQRQSPPPQTPALTATLRPPPAPLPIAQPLPELKLDTSRQTEPEPAPPPLQKPRPLLQSPQGKASPPQPPLAREVQRQLARLAARDDFYPQEAILQGLEGEAWVQIFLDESGSVIAARIDRSSGHTSLDQAALRAARSLRSLPSSGLEEAVLPVRFRLE